MAESMQIVAFEGGELRPLGPEIVPGEAVLALPLSRLVVKMVRVAAEEDPVKTAAESLAAVSPFPDEQLTVSCETVGETEDGRTVLAAALPEGAADDIADALDAAKINVTKVDILALGESGNFPAAIKVTAEYFPKKDRAFATSIFNAGASVGALAAPLLIPPLAVRLGWEWAFIIIGGLGFIWIFFWTFMYEKPEKSPHVNEAELAYIHQDDTADASPAVIPGKAEEAKSIPFLQCLKYKQTWAFITGKFFTDGVWWFFLFWAPSYFSNQFNAPATSGLGQALIFTLYAIVTVVSIVGGYLPKIFVEKKGLDPYAGRMLAMLIFAFFPIAALFAQPLGINLGSAWWPAILIGLAGAGHQAWSANLYSTIGDMFPKSTIASITGIGTTAGGIGSMIIQKVAGELFTHAEEAGAAFRFLGFEGKPAGYFIVFCYCGIAYLLAWVIMKSLVPKYKPIEI